MPQVLQISDKERTARQSTICPACLGEKQVGGAVCWDCFKYTKKFTPLKYSDKYFDDWLMEVAQK